MRVCKLLVLREMVGAIGFEPTASWSRTRRASQAALRPDIAQERDSRAGTKNSTANLPQPETPVRGCRMHRALEEVTVGETSPSGGKEKADFPRTRTAMRIASREVD
jgi:hypothetical protein